MNANRDHADKSQYRTHRDDYLELLWCVVFLAGLAVFDWLLR